MRIVDPSYEILRCPDGEECLAFLERVTRLAYKSEDRIDSGREPCPVCFPDGKTGDHDMGFYAIRTPNPSCETCGGCGGVQVREPSSHKLLRRVLKADRRVQLAKKVHDRFQGQEPMAWEVLSRELVNFVLDELRDDPPHESVIEHEHISVLFVGNRGFTHELVRHRLAAFTQESTRYCNYHKGKFGSEISVTDRAFWGTPTSEDDVHQLEEKLQAHVAVWKATNISIEEGYMELIRQGVPAQIARDLLPQVLKAEIVLTTNLREWRHIFRMRCSPKAHPDMRALMIPLRDELRSRIPIIFDEV